MRGTAGQEDERPGEGVTLQVWASTMQPAGVAAAEAYADSIGADTWMLRIR